MSEFAPEIGNQIAEACADTLMEFVREHDGKPFNAVALLPSVVALVLHRTMPTSTPAHDAQACDLVRRHAAETLAILRLPDNRTVLQ